MRRFVVAFVATVVGLVLLLSFKSSPTRSAGRPAALGAPTPGSGDASSGNPAQASPSAPSQPSQPSQPAAKPASGTTVLGSSVQVSEGFRTFGSVQVKLTLTNGKITDVTAVDYPRNDGRSYEISSYSIPILRQEVLQAQGTQIDIVSGATYTSDAYAQSVQAALDKAKS